MHKIAFNTANLVGRPTHYRFSLSNWMEQHKKVIESTDAREFNALCAEIAAAGFSAVELWQAHADPSVFTPAKAKAWREILDAHDLDPIAYASGLSRETAQVCAWLGIPMIAGGGHPKNEDGTPDLDKMNAICREFDVRYAFENHPQKTADEILAHIGGGSELLGVAVDTGWLGTQSYDVPKIVRALGSAISHVHLKDVAAQGGHETVPLGTGVVNVEGVCDVLKEMGYSGNYSWEDEPEERNPFDIAASMQEWIAARI